MLKKTKCKYSQSETENRNANTKGENLYTYWMTEICCSVIQSSWYESME